MSGSVKITFRAHKDRLTNLNFILVPEKMLMTTSKDKYIQIWTAEGKLKAALNLNHPLPTVWDIGMKT